MIERAHQRPTTRVHELHHTISGTPGIRKSPEQQAAPQQTSNADKARVDEQTAWAAAYSSKTTTPSGLPIDNNERLVLGQLVAQINDDIRAISGTPNGNIGGLQAPRIPGAGHGR
jgi:hypothetical protein